MTDFLDCGPPAATHRLILAHGAGAGMTSPFMDEIAALLAYHQLATTRFEFAYMAVRRTGGKRRPPPKAEALAAEYHDVLLAVATQKPRNQTLLIGGKSLGGRIASLGAEQAFAGGLVAGLVCLGYPFHPPNQPDKLRTSHLERLTCPALIVQGERDPFGHRFEAMDLKLSPKIKLTWIRDGDHDFRPRGASGTTRQRNLQSAAAAVAAFATGLNPSD